MLSDRKLKDLRAAYRATVIELHLPEGLLTFRVGGRPLKLRTWLKKEGARSWVVITPFNPGSRAISLRENRARLLRFVRSLGDRKKLRADGIDPKGEWGTERGFLLVDLSRAEITKLARRWGQNAVFAGTIDGKVRLVWIPPS